MAQPQINANKTKALRIGQRLMVGAKSFGKGVRSSVDTSQQVITQSARKIKSDQKRINTENRKQQRFEEAIREETERRQKGMFSGGYKLGDSSKKLVEKVLVDPLAAFWKIVGAWVIMNLPTIIEELRKFVKKVRIVVASINNALRATGNLFKGFLATGQAWLTNMVTFDFKDSTGRLEKAQGEVDGAYDELNASWETIYNVWGKEEKELDDMLAWLDSGKTVKETADAITKGLPIPQTPAFGPGSGGGGGISGDGGYRGTANTYGLAIPTATNTKWAPVLNLIASVESVGGSYDSIYPSTTKPGLSSMTIAEADTWQASTARSRGSAAAGRYQFMNIKSQAAAAGIGPNEQFSPENQDKMAIALIEGKRGVTTGMLASNPGEAQMRLAQEWAGLPKDFTNKSYYGNDGINKSGTDTQSVRGAFSDVLTGGVSTPAGPEIEGAGNINYGQLSSVLTSKDFDTTDRSVASPIIKTSLRGQRNGRHHGGIDYAPPAGETGWYCAYNSNGRVTFVGSLGGYGKTVIIQFGGVELLFAHLARYAPGISRGASYSAGSPIGEIGSTGRSSGIHLHFEARPPGGGGGSDIPAQPYVGGLVFGRYSTRGGNSNIATPNTSVRSLADQLNITAASNRTNGNKNNTQTIIIRETTITK